ncbi:MAG: hypothetical protein IPG82_00040 [Saprospiraceae bacterium]|nr:hypothetical protein [Saprospiraceae bacterium]
MKSGFISELLSQNNCKSFNVLSATLSNFVASLMKFRNNVFFSFANKVFVLHFSAIKVYICFSSGILSSEEKMFEYSEMFISDRNISSLSSSLAMPSFLYVLKKTLE